MAQVHWSFLSRRTGRFTLKTIFIKIFIPYLIWNKKNYRINVSNQTFSLFLREASLLMYSRVTDVTGCTNHVSGVVLLFSEWNEIFFGYYDSEELFKIRKIYNLRGDLTDISYKRPHVRGLITYARSLYILCSRIVKNTACIKAGICARRPLLDGNFQNRLDILTQVYWNRILNWIWVEKIDIAMALHRVVYYFLEMF